MDASILSELSSGGGSIVTPAAPPLVLEATENKILFSGESLQFNITGGTPPYTYETDGPGQFGSDGVYHAGYNYNNITSEQVTVRDSNGQVAIYTVPIKSFTNQEVFNLVPNGGLGARSKQIISASDGTLYIVGRTGRSSVNWLVMKSTDNGISWTALDSQQSSRPNSEANAIAISAAGHIFVVGTSKVDGQTGKSLFVRKSVDQGQTWTTVRQFQGFVDQDTVGVDIAVGSGDHVFVLVSVENATDTFNWVLEKSSNGGASWDSFTIATNEPALSTPRTLAISPTQMNHIFVGGKSSAYYTVRASYDGGVNWSIVDQVTRGGHVNSIAIAPTGAIFSAGRANFTFTSTGSPSGNTGEHALLRVSYDNGTTWAYADYTLEYEADYSDIAISPNFTIDGKIYVTALTTDFGGTWDSHYIVRESTDFGVTWTQKEKIQKVVNFDSVSTSLAFQPGGDLFSTGYAATSGLDVNKNYFSILVRKVNFLGAPLATLYDYNPLGKRFSKAKAMTRTPAGDLYAIGDAENISNLISNWIVRKSTDNGVTWTTVDTFACGDFGCNANAITSDADGRIYVIGENKGNSTNDFFWTVRRSLDNGATWLNHNWQMAATKSAYGKGIQALPDGTVLAVGQAFTAGNAFQNIIRRSTDFGANWTTVSSASTSQVQTLAFENSSTVYAVGGTILKSTNGGVTWADFLTIPNNYITGMAVHNSKLYIIARDSTVFSAQRYHVLRSSDNGVTWETIDSMLSGNTTNPSSIIVKSDQEIFYSGAYTDNKGQSGLVRWTKDGGATWTNIEKSQISSGYSGFVSQIIFCSDDFTKVCHAGYASDSNSIDSWIVRILSF